MADISAKDVKVLRDATGAGMMDAKRALVENDGDFDRAAQWLREKGLGKAAERSERENAQGSVGLAVAGQAAALVELKCETDFVAMNPDFVALVQDLAERVAAEGEQATDAKKDEIDSLKVTLKENIDLGRVVRLEAAPGQIVDSYLHKQGGRGVNGVIVVLDGGTPELAHDVAVHIGFGKPSVLSRDEVPAEEVERERETLAAQTRNEGKPEQAIPKIVEGKLNAFFAERVLLDQKFVKDEKQTVAQALGGATIVRFAQVLIGA